MPSSPARFTYQARSDSEATSRTYNFTFDTGSMLDDANLNLSDSELDLDSLGSSPKREFYPCDKPRTAYRSVRPGILHRINLPGVGTARFGVNVPDERLPHSERIPNGNDLPELPREICTGPIDPLEPIRSMSLDEREASIVSVEFQPVLPANKSTDTSIFGPSYRRVEVLQDSVGSDTEFGDSLRHDGMIREYYEQCEPSEARSSSPIANDASQARAQRQEDSQGAQNTSSQGPVPVRVVVEIDYDPALLEIRGYDVRATPRSTSAGEGDAGVQEAEGKKAQNKQAGERSDDCRMH
ncbi:hypothetical protein F5Y05DRAFT_388263 [Hypoxylon sp. FL0543]|nr:hypothetical protein F5Y05DRAFT_388263 [Hypoxylon sp. FL0543]